MSVSKSLLLVLLCVFISCKEKSAETAIAPDAVADATYYLIRHADKVRGANAGTDPELTAKGKARADFWAETLKEVDFDAVYSTDYKRTRSTALPVAKLNDVPLSIYDAQNLFNKEFQQETNGKTVLIVGHSNTTPAFVNAILGEQKYQEIDDSVFGNLYIVRIENGKPVAELKSYNDWTFD